MKKNILLFICLLVQSLIRLFAIDTEVVGVVRDSLTRETLPYVSIYFKNTTRGTITDVSGRFTIMAKESGQLVFSMMGYKDYRVNVKADGVKRNLKINLSPDNVALGEVVVTSKKKQKYRSKNNPAVDLVKEMIDKRDVYDPKRHDYCSYDKYQKITYAWNEFEEGKYNGLSRKFGFLYDHTDTSRYGKTILPVGLRESASSIYCQTNPEKKRELIRAQKSVGIDEIFPQEGVKKTLDEMFREIDLFQNDIVLLSNHFVSPLSNVAPSFYKYFVIDTLVVDGDSCVNLAFTPRTTEAYGFTGSLYVSLDSTRFVHHAHFNVPKDINLNFVESLYMEQDFEKSGDGTRLIKKDYVCVEFFVPALPRVYGERLNSYNNYGFRKTKDYEILEESAPIIEAKNANKQDDVAWDTLRHSPLSAEEKRTDSLMLKLHDVKLFRVVKKGLEVCINNYIPTKKVGSQFDYGPFFSTISKNRLEGFRVRVGGETTTFFDEHFFINTYLAFGCKDKLPKGMGSLEYSFNKKKLYHVEFPVHSIKAYGKFDVGKVGESFVGYDNILASLFSRTDDRNAIYQREFGVVYQNEFYNGFSYNLEYAYKTYYATWLTKFKKYSENGTFSEIDDYSMSTLKLSLRYAPHEKFYQSRRFRYQLNKEHPEFNLTHNASIKDVLGSSYTYNRTEGSYSQRFWMSYFGYVDVFLKATKVWNNVPYTLLDVPDASSSYTIKEKAFSLLDPVEFLCNQSLTWDIAYFLNGLILDRVPIIRKLQLREFVTFKGVYGKLSDDSNPMKAENKDRLFVLPTTSYAFEQKPYMEVGVGLDNILKLFRLSYSWRLTYKEHKDVPKHGLRFALHIDF